MKFYIIYDNLYEEYQLPFVMKNDTIALNEFQQFIENLKTKTQDEKEKAKITKRYFLAKFPDIEFKKIEDDVIIEFENKQKMPEILTRGEDDE